MAAEPTFPSDNAYLLIRIAGDIAPNLADKPQDQASALRMAWKMVQSYHPATEAEVTTAARIVSLSMTQLDLLREAAKPDLTPAMKLRYINAAVRVNREICQTERTLERRQLAEERRPVAQQPVEVERINRSSNKAAVDQALIDQLMQEMALMDAIRRQEAEADLQPPSIAEPCDAPPERSTLAADCAESRAARSHPVTDSVKSRPAAPEPVAGPAAEPAIKGPPPPTAEAARAFFLRAEETRVNHHAALATIAPETQGARFPGAGSPPPNAQAASPG